MRLLAYWSVRCHVAGNRSSSTAGYAAARSVVTSIGVTLVVPIARSKHRRAAALSRRGETNTFDDLPELVDRTVDVAPPAGDLCEGLIGLPAVADRVPAGPGHLSQERCEPHDPAVDGDVVDFDAAFGEQLFDVAVGETKRRYQRTASTITSGGKQKPAKADRAMGLGRTRRVLLTPVWLLGSGHSNATTPLGSPQ
jgi:hypothetical protein